MKNKIIGIYNKSEIITLLGLVFASLGIFSCMAGNALHGVFCLMWAGMCDGFDGVIAKRLTRDKKAEFYGVELDSFVDIVSFGVLPIAIGWSLGLKSPADIILFIFYICCGVIRLAYFNTLSAHEPPGPVSFTGLPITTVSIILPLVYFIFQNTGFINAYRIIFLFSGFLYILNFKVKKLRLLYRIILCAIGVLVIILTFPYRS